MNPEEVDNLLANPPKDAVPPLRFFQSLEFASNVRMCDAKGRYWFVRAWQGETEWREGDSGVTPDTWLLLPDLWKEVYPPEEAKEGDPIAADVAADDLAFKTGYTTGAEAAEARFKGKIETLEKALDIAAKNYDDAEQRAAALAEERAEWQAKIDKAKEDRTIVRNQLAESNRQFNVLRAGVDKLEAQLQDLAQNRQTLSDSYDVLMDELEATRTQRDTAEAALAQTHEFEVVGKLHKVHHSDLVPVLQQVMEMAEANRQAGDANRQAAVGLEAQLVAKNAEAQRLANQLVAIRKMSKVV